jgi:uncharacterized protein
MSDAPAARSAPRPIPQRVARELKLEPRQVEGALALFAGGATLPFVARYRKEATGGLDEVQLGEVLARARFMRRRGFVYSTVVRGKTADAAAARFRDYFTHREPVSRIAGHRVLAMRRGEAEGVLQWGIEHPEPEVLPGVEARALHGRRAGAELREVARDAYKRLLTPSIESDLRAELTEAADEEAIRVFGANLEQLLLQPPAGQRAVLGLDPGFRTGVKAAVVSRTGAVLETATLELTRTQGQRARPPVALVLELHDRHQRPIGAPLARRGFRPAPGTGLPFPD